MVICSTIRTILKVLCRTERSTEKTRWNGMFRGAVRGDLAQILKIYAHARAAMKESGNPTQWGDNFPPQELLEEDIDSNRLFLYVVNGQIEAVFAFILGADPTYAAIEDGQWLDDTLPYGTVHRLAEPACRHPRRQQDHAASAGKERLYPLRHHPCGRRLAPLCLPEACPHPAAGSIKIQKPLELLHWILSLRNSPFYFS